MSRVDRRTFVVNSIVSTWALPALASLPQNSEDNPARPPGTRPPNVVVMVCDDLGHGDLGCYGSSIRTPNLDRMATEGVRFTRFNTAHPVCSVSRAAWLTGRYAVRSHTQDAYFPKTQEGMDLDEKTLADILKTRGYKSTCIGKWHLGELPQYLPTNRGFDSFFGVPYSDDMNPLPLIRDLTTIEESTDRDLLTPRYTEEAVKVIDSSAGQPFFLWVAYSYPHDPARASAKFAGKSKQGTYGDCVEEIDWSVGEILNAIKRNNLDSDTVVIFSSDHGPWYQGSPGNLRGRKHSTYEGGTRLPFIARWTGTIPAGKIVNTWGSNLDLVPTIASICRAQLSSNPVDGLDITTLLTGKGTEPQRGTILYFLDGALECARKGSWKLRISIGTADTGGGAGAAGGRGTPAANGRGGTSVTASGSPSRVPYMFANPELYNLDDDPAESYDVAHSNPEIVKQIMQDIEKLIPTFPKDVIDAFVAQRSNPDSSLTPTGASPRPANYVSPPMIWDPPRGF